MGSMKGLMLGRLIKLKLHPDMSKIITKITTNGENRKIVLKILIDSKEE